MSPEENQYYQRFGSRLRTARKSAGMSQEELARKLGLARTSVVNKEKGRQATSAYEALVIARILGVAIGELMS